MSIDGWDVDGWLTEQPFWLRGLLLSAMMIVPLAIFLAIGMLAGLIPVDLTGWPIMFLIVAIGYWGAWDLRKK